MNIYLAGSGLKNTCWLDRKFYNFYRLESFLSITSSNEHQHIGKYRGFMLDSGAYSYMAGKDPGKISWDDYIEKYADFINKYNVKQFIELDIDKIVGLPEVERLRAKLEVLTNKKSIPVFHKSRGKDYWLKMVKEYDYVAIGGIVVRDIKPSDYRHFHWFLKTAKENNCRVHGLGFTNLKGLKEYPFHSVDSTSWLSGNRFGSIYKFNGETLLKYNRKKNQRVKTNKTAINNFKEWVKYADYMINYKHKTTY